MNQMVGDRAVLAEVDGQLWDIHRPLEGNVKVLKFLHFKEVSKGNHDEFFDALVVNSQQMLAVKAFVEMLV